MICFIRCGELVRIETTKRKPEVLLDTLSKEVPFRLELICTIPGADIVELAELKKRFASQHYRGNWYNYKDDLYEYINNGTMRKIEDLEHRVYMLEKELYSKTTSLPPAKLPVDVVLHTNDKDAGTVTEISLMAIRHMAKSHGYNTEEEIINKLICNTATGITRSINKLEELSYFEGVRVIKYMKHLNSVGWESIE